jgi:CMP-N-acetylneuraminic acid synthetase
MYKDKRILAVITARGGSKGLPGKNILELEGKPLIAWTIEHIHKSRLLDKTFISTDSREIAIVCERYGIAVPELRPDELSQDTSSSMDVLAYTIDLLERKDEKFDYVILLEPTSPLRKEDDIDKMIRLAVENPDADGVISLGRVHMEHPSITKKVGTDGYIVQYMEDVKYFYQRQLEDEAYFPYGVGYLMRVDRFKDTHSIYMKKMLPYFIERWQNYEVDDIYDFKCIEAIIKMEREK